LIKGKRKRKKRRKKTSPAISPKAEVNRRSDQPWKVPIMDGFMRRRMVQPRIHGLAY
jgi:hypothetical protein